MQNDLGRGTSHIHGRGICAVWSGVRLPWCRKDGMGLGRGSKTSPCQHTTMPSCPSLDLRGSYSTHLLLILCGQLGASHPLGPPCSSRGHGAIRGPRVHSGHQPIDKVSHRLPALGGLQPRAQLIQGQPHLCPYKIRDLLQGANLFLNHRLQGDHTNLHTGLLGDLGKCAREAITVPSTMDCSRTGTI